MKKPVAIIFNDTHLKTGNEVDIELSVDHMLEYAVENSIDTLIFAGDLFDSRSFQRQELLLTLGRILKKVHEKNLLLYMFPGNHDKTVYSSFDSFLEPYKHYPNVIFNREISRIELKGITIDLLPFFSNEMLVPMIEKAEGADILISHFEMNGSSNLGHIIDDSPINRTMLKKWKKVYLGHFHNHMEITKNVVHLPSLRQNNFGEDANKGFSVLYNDLSYEVVEGRFKKFWKIDIDLNNVSIGEIQKLIKTHRNSTNTVRFEFTGDENKLKALDMEQFKGTDIDAKRVYEKNFDVAKLEMPKLVKKHSKSSVVEDLETFCKEKGYDINVGKALLLEFLKTR